MSIPRLLFCHIYWLAHSSADLYSQAQWLHLFHTCHYNKKIPHLDFKISLWVYIDKLILYCSIIGISALAPAQFHPQNCTDPYTSKTQNKSFLSISFPLVFPPSKIHWGSSYNTEIFQEELSYYWRILFHRAIQSVTQFCIKLR